MRVLITGANGFVGQSLIPYLLKKGHEVVACTRNFQSLAAFETHSKFQIKTIAPIEQVTESEWVAALQDVDAVVHLAARVHVMKEAAADALEEYRKVNVEGTRHLANACVLAGVRRFVYLSSIKVNGEQTQAKPFSEEDQPAPQDPYGFSKHEAEEVLREIASRSKLEVGIVRPPLIYGPKVRANFLHLLNAVDRHWPLPFGSVKGNKRSLLHIENLVSAIEKILTAPPFKFEVFLVADNEAPSTLELVQVMKHSLKSKSILVPVPVSALKSLACVTRKIPQMDRLTGSLEVSNQKLKKFANWTPPYSLKQGMDHTAEWYKSEKKSI
ncbi:MAG: NAD-dependent epimerase/dehydratase family protein [Bdellovibrionales bacterium]